MPAGFQAWGDGNFVQVDENYRNMMLTRAGYYTGEFSVYAAQTSIIAYRPTDGATVKMEYQRWSGSTREHRMSTNGGCYVYIFDFAAPQAGGAGIEVFDGTGNLVFSSNNDYMKVVAQFDTTAAYNGVSVPDTNWGRNCAVAPMAMSSGFVLVGDHWPESDLVDISVDKPAINLSGGNIAAYMQGTVYNYLPSQYQYFQPSATYFGLFIDVSGFPTSL